MKRLQHEREEELKEQIKFWILSRSGAYPKDESQKEVVFSLYKQQPAHIHKQVAKLSEAQQQELFRILMETRISTFIDEDGNRIRYLNKQDYHINRELLTVCVHSYVRTRVSARVCVCVSACVCVRACLNINIHAAYSIHPLPI
jgi:HD-GYP domain-containing protein (c-di-GMP phosphodiesterase class II)